MVKSRLYPDKITYKEDSILDEEDVGYASASYEFIIHGEPVIIALGKEKYTYSRYDVVYYPIYLIVNEEPVAKIGVFEVDSHQVINILDEDGDLDLSKGHILLYVKDRQLHRIIEKNQQLTGIVQPTDIPLPVDEVEENELSQDKNNEITDEEDEDIGVTRIRIPAEKRSASLETAEKTIDTGIFILTDDHKLPPDLPEETEADANKEKQKYRESARNPWIQKFTHNNNFNIIDNEGGGDCFFAVIRDAFEQIGQQTTVSKLRALLSKDVTQELFEETRGMYLGFLSAYQSQEKEMKDLKKVSLELKKRIERTTDKATHKLLLDEAKTILERFNEIKHQKELTKEMMNEYAYMEDITTLEKYRELILTSKFWADAWAISTLERLLNIKVIILSEEAFKEGDVDSVLRCGQLVDAVLESRGQFVPDYYIMTSYTGQHYKLVTYKNKHILKFHEIPYDVKAMVVNKCMERTAGPYYIIRDFQNFNDKLGIPRPNKDDDATLAGEGDDEYLHRDLYEKDIEFVFHANSNSKPKAGQGSGEHIPSKRIMEYNRLNTIKDWRKMLDDSWAAQFTVESSRWNTVEHYFLGSQFKKGFPDFYQQFSLDSGSDISKDLELARAAGGKSGKLKDRVLREKRITIDPDFYEVGMNSRSKLERKTALEAKFSQNLDLKTALLETKQAKLVHFLRGKEPETDELLMTVRKELS